MRDRHENSRLRASAHTISPPPLPARKLWKSRTFGGGNVLQNAREVNGESPAATTARCPEFPQPHPAPKPSARRFHALIGSGADGAFRSVDRMGSRGLRPVTLPHHRTCGLPHPAVEPGGGRFHASAISHGMTNPWWLSVRFLSACCMTGCRAMAQAPRPL
jgi:hypothetical protein